MSAPLECSSSRVFNRDDFPRARQLLVLPDRFAQTRDGPRGGLLGSKVCLQRGQQPTIRRSTICSTLRIIGSVHLGFLRGEKRPTERQETVSEGAERGVVMKAAPGSALVVIEAELALHLLVIS